MTPTAPVPVQPVLRGCLHLLVLALLGLAVARAVAEDAPHAGAVLAAAVAVGLIYAVGPALPSVQRSTAAAAIWLTILGLGWLVLLYWTPDGIWLAFPLFFVQLHLLPMRWGLTAVATTTVAAIAGFAWHQDGLTAPMVLGPVLGAAVAVATVLGYQALYRESEARRRLIDELTAARADLAAAEHTGGVLAERERLAREIHDTLAQGLSSIQLLLRAAERALPGRSDSALGHVRQARQAAVDNLAEARRFVRDWTPPGLEVAGSLPAALKQLCATTADAFGLAVHASISGVPIELPAAQETALLRIAQAALANAVQHGQPSRVELTLSYMGTDVALDIVDDGTGFDPELVAPPGQGPDGTGFGLAAMRARARALQGALVVESAPGKGTAVAATLPVPAGTVEEVSA
ncbi:sensor histidine kinase [Blastococcus sp. MG754426]|uniref:Oxygen sensor histidine kinase NreB n=1 Tax=Blastococcus aggregatus TaxID=38502 RepID=A0A285VKD8_9ACTN|nr:MULTISPECIES: sensor histidine kinase [Blastococcus]MCF6506725.1 sensor histidine kinase [Blastococcus sp. MG754426]MCF6511536.1 sensor histidine kinase [Blastococcus sp. MG754427]SOC53031.1 Signal transduction histidine kinase [Blastococcus aggregatus]SSC22147.1 Signal transduction histidine kinase, ChrS [Klenkia terrae]